MGKRAKRSKKQPSLPSGENLNQKAGEANDSATARGTNDDDKNEVPESDDKSLRTMILEGVGVGVCGVLSNNFFSTDHKILGVWFSFGALASLLALLATASAKKYSPKKTWLAYGIALMPVAIVFAMWSTNLSKPQTNIDESGNPIGLLLPANDPMPDVSWAPSNSCFMIFGGNICAATPSSIIPAIRFLGDDVLQIGQNDKGAFVNGTFFDNDRKLVAILETNEWTLNRFNYFRKFPTKNSLIVTDMEDKELLNVRFSNRNLFRITGIFRFPDGSEAIVTTNYLDYTGGSVTGIKMNGNTAYSSGGFQIIKFRGANAVSWGIGVPQGQ